MASEAPRRAMQTGRVRSDGAHYGFLRHNNFQWLKVGASVSQWYMKMPENFAWNW